MSDDNDKSSAEPGNGFLGRARLRRRLRHLERAKEIGLRDAGGLVLELHRAGRQDAELVAGKLEALDRIDAETAGLRAALGTQSAAAELREPGIALCTNCSEVIGSADNFCSNCGTPTDR